MVAGRQGCEEGQGWGERGAGGWQVAHGGGGRCDWCEGLGASASPCPSYPGSAADHPCSPSFAEVEGAAQTVDPSPSRPAPFSRNSHARVVLLLRARSASESAVFAAVVSESQSVHRSAPLVERMPASGMRRHRAEEEDVPDSDHNTGWFGRSESVVIAVSEPHPAASTPAREPSPPDPFISRCSHKPNLGWLPPRRSQPLSVRLAKSSTARKKPTDHLEPPSRSSRPSRFSSRPPTRSK